MKEIISNWERILKERANGFNKDSFEKSINELVSLVYGKPQPLEIIYIEKFSEFKKTIEAEKRAEISLDREPDSWDWWIYNLICVEKLFESYRGKIDSEIVSKYGDQLYKLENVLKILKINSGRPDIWYLQALALEIEESKGRVLKETEKIYINLAKNFPEFVKDGNRIYCFLDRIKNISIFPSFNEYPRANKIGITEFTSGYVFYDFNWQEISEQLVKCIQTKTLSPDSIDVSGESKLKILYLYYQLYGLEELVNLYEMVEIDSYTHGKDQYILYKVDLGEDSLFFVKFDGNLYAVSSKFSDSVVNAVGSLYRIPYKLKNHIKYIKRQEKRFVVILTDEGKDLARNLDEKDVKDLVGISGFKYFGLLV